MKKKFVLMISKFYVSIFQFNRNSGRGNDESDLWIAYCAFHLGDYKRSMEVC